MSSSQFCLPFLLSSWIVEAGKLFYQELDSIFERQIAENEKAFRGEESPWSMIVFQKDILAGLGFCGFHHKMASSKLLLSKQFDRHAGDTNNQEKRLSG